MLSRFKLKHFDICIYSIEQLMLSINNLTQKIATKVLCRLRSAVVKVDQGGQFFMSCKYPIYGVQLILIQK